MGMFVETTLLFIVIDGLCIVCIAMDAKREMQTSRPDVLSSAGGVSFEKHPQQVKNLKVQRPPEAPCTAKAVNSFPPGASRRELFPKPTPHTSNQTAIPYLPQKNTSNKSHELLGLVL